MSDLAEDMLGKAVKAVGRMKKPDWRVPALKSEEWDKVSAAVVKVMDEMRGHGAAKPLAKLQELAFERALADPGNKALQTVALWLTDSRLTLDRYVDTKDEHLRRRLEHRGLVKAG